MKAEDTISMVQRSREENGDDWKEGVEKGKEKERNKVSLPIRDYFMQSSIERERRLLDENRVKWIARRMKMIGEEMKERFQGEGVEYRAVEKEPATKSPQKIEQLLCWEQYLMELLLLYEMNEWERRFWNKLKTFLDNIGSDQVEVKERLTREWRAHCWKRLNPQMDAAVKRLAKWPKSAYFGEQLRKRWASSISHFEGSKNQIQYRYPK
jgi:hypothetical protein